MRETKVFIYASETPEQRLVRRAMLCHLDGLLAFAEEHNYHHGGWSEAPARLKAQFAVLGGSLWRLQRIHTGADLVNAILDHQEEYVLRAIPVWIRRHRLPHPHTDMPPLDQVLARPPLTDPARRYIPSGGSMPTWLAQSAS